MGMLCTVLFLSNPGVFDNISVIFEMISCTFMYPPAGPTLDMN